MHLRHVIADGWAAVNELVCVHMQETLFLQETLTGQVSWREGPVAVSPHTHSPEQRIHIWVLQTQGMSRACLKV